MWAAASANNISDNTDLNKMFERNKISFKSYSSLELNKKTYSSLELNKKALLHGMHLPLKFEGEKGCKKIWKKIRWGQNIFIFEGCVLWKGAIFPKYLFRCLSDNIY